MNCVAFDTCRSDDATPASTASTTVVPRLRTAITRAAGDRRGSDRDAVAPGTKGAKTMDVGPGHVARHCSTPFRTPRASRVRSTSHSWMTAWAVIGPLTLSTKPWAAVVVAAAVVAL